MKTRVQPRRRQVGLLEGVEDRPAGLAAAAAAAAAAELPLVCEGVAPRATTTMLPLVTLGPMLSRASSM